MATLAPHPPVRLRALLTLAAPVVASRLGIMAMGLVDTLVVGRHSAVELGYLALAWAPTGVVLTTAIGLLQGVQVLTSQAIGAGRSAATGAILRRGLVYAFWVGWAAALVLAGAGPVLLAHVGLDPHLAAGATPVLRLLALSLPPIMLADAGIFWLEAHGRATPGTIAMWGANVVNLGLNLWLVPGHSGFAVAGAAASAWSTALSRTALLLFTAVAVVVWPQARGFGVFRRAPREAGAAAALRRVGYAASISYAVESSAFSAMTVIAGWLGAAAVASWAIVLNLMALVFMVPLGLATATAVLVGRAYGARDAVGVRRAGLLGLRRGARGDAGGQPRHRGRRRAARGRLYPRRRGAAGDGGGAGARGVAVFRDRRAPGRRRPGAARARRHLGADRDAHAQLCRRPRSGGLCRGDPARARGAGHRLGGRSSPARCRRGCC